MAKHPLVYKQVTQLPVIPKLNCEAATGAREKKITSAKIFTVNLFSLSTAKRRYSFKIKKEPTKIINPRYVGAFAK